MDLPRIFTITESAHRIYNPFTLEKLANSLHGLWELYFERKFRILNTIDFEKGEVIIEAIKHKDEF